jgi:hypothetical protein
MKENEKLSTASKSNRFEVQPPTFYQGLERFVRGENRLNSANAIGSLLQEVFSAVEGSHACPVAAEMILGLEGAVHGLHSLAATYKLDPIMSAAMSTYAANAQHRVDTFKTSLRPFTQIWLSEWEAGRMQHVSAPYSSYGELSTSVLAVLTERHEQEGGVNMCAKIDRDTKRTFAGERPFSNGGDGVNVLTNMLRAYAVLDGEVGYVQGMNYICGCILINTCECSRPSEACIFWVFVSVMSTMRPLFAPGMPAYQTIISTYSPVLAALAPDLAKHLKDIPYGLMSKWLHSAYCHPSIPTATVLQLWVWLFERELATNQSSAPEGMRREGTITHKLLQLSVAMTLQLEPQLLLLDIEGQLALLQQPPWAGCAAFHPAALLSRATSPAVKEEVAKQLL